MPNNKTFRVSLDMKAPTAQRNEWEVVEGDNGNVIEITLTDDGAPVDLQGCKVLAVFGLPTGQTVEQDTDEGSVTIGGTDHNVITIALKTGSFSPGKSSSGLMKCEIQVYSGNDLDVLVTSAQFTFRCRRAIINDETIAATDDYPILVELINEVQELENNWQADWTEADPMDHSYIKNKPSTFPPSSHNHGRIDSNGRTQTTYAHEAGDWLMVADYSDSGRIMRTDITFGNATNKWLRNDGAWTAPAPADVGTMRYYMGVEDVGLTVGSATIEGTWAAMETPSMMIVHGGQFSDAPSGGLYIVEIVKRASDRGWIFAYGKTSTDRDYRMFLNSSGVPSGTWIETPHSAVTGTVTAGDITPTTTTDNFHLARIGQVVYFMIRFKPTVANASMKICTLPTGFRPSNRIVTEAFRVWTRGNLSTIPETLSVIISSNGVVEANTQNGPFTEEYFIQTSFPIL